MPHRSALTIEHDLEDMRNEYNVVRGMIGDAVRRGAGRIEDLPAFLYIEYAMRWTAFQELLEEYEKAESHKAAGLRREKLWKWLQDLPEDTSEYDSAVEAVEE